MSRISQDSIDLAVLRLFRERDGFTLGTRILYAQLERRWRSTGLRRSDLAQSIARLERSACVRVIHEAVPGPDIELLLPGYRRLVPVLLSAGEWMKTLSAGVELLRAHWRRANAGPGAARRRRDDRVRMPRIGL